VRVDHVQEQVLPSFQDKIVRMIGPKLSLIAYCLLMAWGFARMDDRKVVSYKSTTAGERAVSVGSNE